jgi:LysR family glycine cleavage system transcriptional activator
MQNKFPSMTGLRAFESAARHQSFTRASIELNLTQSAISHQIRKLEEMIGSKLFERHGSDIRLTETGLEYLGPARSAITELQFATDRAIGRGQDDVLTVASLGTFMIKCLLPHLGDFIASNPDIHLRVKTLLPFSQGRPDDYDVSIQYGMDSDWQGFVSTRISTEEVFPVCSPLLVEGPSGLKEPQDLAEHAIVRTTSPLILRDDWALWLRRAGVADLVFAREIGCDLLYPSYQIAIEGLGVALGRSAVVQSDILAGRLVEPFSIRLPTPLGYHIVHPPHHSGMPKVKRFTAWAGEVLAKKLDC